MSTAGTHVYITQSVWKNIARKKQASKAEYIFSYPGIDEILSVKERRNLGNQAHLEKLLQDPGTKLMDRTENIKITSKSHQKIELGRFHLLKDCEAMRSDFQGYSIRERRRKEAIQDKKVILYKQYGLGSIPLGEALKILSQEFGDNFYCLDVDTNEQIALNGEKQLKNLEDQVTKILDNELKKDTQKHHAQIEKLFNKENDSSINEMIHYFQEKWDLTVAETTFEMIEKPNSGIGDHEIETLELATKRLDEKIKDINIYVRNNLYINDGNKYIYNKLKFHTYLFKETERNNIKLPKNFDNDKKLQNILRDLPDEEYTIFTNYAIKVSELKTTIEEYIRMKVNPDLLIEGENAEKLGLIACGKCKR